MALSTTMAFINFFVVTAFLKALKMSGSFFTGFAPNPKIRINIRIIINKVAVGAILVLLSPYSAPIANRQIIFGSFEYPP